MKTHAVAGNTIKVNGTTLYYEETGAGLPIVFSHGLLWNTSMFREQISALQAEYRCVAYDHRGQGRSADDRAAEITVDVLAADAAALIEQLNLGPVNFVGHSLGGFVGLALALRRPELLRSLVLCSTSADAEPVENLPKYRLLNLFARFLGPAAVANAVMPIMHGSTFLADENQRALKERSRSVLANNRKSIWRAANGVINRRELFSELPNITVKTMVVTGEEDRARTVAEAQRLAGAIPGANLVCVPRAGHMLPIEAPEDFTTAIRDFV